MILVSGNWSMIRMEQWAYGVIGIWSSGCVELRGYWRLRKWAYAKMCIWARDVWAISIFPLPCPLFYAPCFSHPFLHAPICHIHSLLHMSIALYAHCPISPCLIRPLPDITITQYAHCLVCTFLQMPYYPIRPLPYMSLLQTTIDRCPLSFMPIATNDHCFIRPLQA